MCVMYYIHYSLIPQLRVLYTTSVILYVCACRIPNPKPNPNPNPNPSPNPNPNPNPSPYPSPNPKPNPNHAFHKSFILRIITCI